MSETVELLRTIRRENEMRMAIIRMLDEHLGRPEHEDDPEPEWVSELPEDLQRALRDI